MDLSGLASSDVPKAFLQGVSYEELAESKSSVDSELELLFRLFRGGALIMLILKHVDDLKMAGKRAIIQEFVDHVSKTFGKMEIEWRRFVFCGVNHVQHEDGSVSMDQIKFLFACKTITHPSALQEDPQPCYPRKRGDCSSHCF